MKRTVEYTRELPQSGEDIKDFLNRMADDRWEFVATYHLGTCIFRRPIQDPYMTSLKEHIKAHENYEVQDDFEKGTIFGLKSAYSMYVNWED